VSLCANSETVSTSADVNETVRDGSRSSIGKLLLFQFLLAVFELAGGRFVLLHVVVVADVVVVVAADVLQWDFLRLISLTTLVDCITLEYSN